MLRSVAVLAQNPVAPFELGVLVEVFGIDRTEEGVPPFDFMICTPSQGVVATAVEGVELTGLHDIDAAASADLVAVPSSPLDAPPDGGVVKAIQAAHARGAYVLSMCSGTYALAWAGILDGQTAATHWRYAQDLQRRFPRVTVDETLLYAQAGTVITGAGTAAAIDACLHLVRLELGGAVAAQIARRMVVAPHREGGQKQFIDRPLPESRGGGLAALLDRVAETVELPHSVESMAATQAVSSRTLIRQFHAELGMTPHAWLTAQRVQHARTLLESTDLSIDSVAHHCGFSDARLLRRHFQRVLNISPNAYRESFAGPRPRQTIHYTPK